MYRYKSESKSPTLSIRTDYSQKRKRKNKINRVKNSSAINNNTNYNVSTNNYNNNNNHFTNIYEYNEINKKPNYIKDPWSKMLEKTSKEGQNIMPNNRKNISNFSLNEHFQNYGQRKHFKESSNYDYTTKTQITTLPGGVKRNKYEIKDDMYFRKPYNESRLYKMIHDYNIDVNYEQNYDPITQGYNVNCFPIRQRFYGSYKRIKDHDIFNTNFNRKYQNEFNDCFCRK